MGLLDNRLGIQGQQYGGNNSGNIGGIKNQNYNVNKEFGLNVKGRSAAERVRSGELTPNSDINVSNGKEAAVNKIERGQSDVDTCKFGGKDVSANGLNFLNEQYHKYLDDSSSINLAA